MQYAEELREQARRLVEGVMKSDENFSQETLHAVRAVVHRLELQAYEIDEQTKKAAT